MKIPCRLGKQSLSNLPIIGHERVGHAIPIPAGQLKRIFRQQLPFRYRPNNGRFDPALDL